MVDRTESPLVGFGSVEMSLNTLTLVTEVVTTKNIPVQISASGLKWCVVSVGNNAVPDYIIAMFDSRYSAEFFVEKMMVNYPNDQKFFDVRKVAE